MQMKKGLYLLAVLGLAAMWVGCKKTEPAAPSAPKKAAQVTSPAAETPVADAASTALTLVQLKVPNMT